MNPAPLHHTASGAIELLFAAASIGAALLYSWGADRLRRRGDTWPWHRDAAFLAGTGSLAYAFTATLPGGPFTAHMGRHLVVGMAAPLLLVLARPLTLAFRALRPGRARRALLWTVHCSHAAWIAFPPSAAAVDLGGLWLLYRTPLFAAVQHSPAAHALLHLHVLAAGVLFSFAVCRLDPVRRDRGPVWSGAALLAAGAAHAVLAKTLYTAPPPGVAVAAADLQTGARLMYYGGDLVELALAAVVACQWYAATGRARSRERRRTAPLAARPGA